MGVKDITEKRLEDYADVFADIVNVLLFAGKEVVQAGQLVDSLPRSIYKADGKIYEQERDTAKYWRVGGVNIALLGLENQTTVLREMPIRVLSYDGASYRQQLNAQSTADEKCNQTPHLHPVVTVVLYFGKERWKHPLNLKGVLEIPTDFEQYVSNYTMNLYEIQYLTDEQVSMFKSDFRYVAELFTQERKVRERQIDKIALTRREITHVKEVLELLKVMTGDNRFEDAFNEQLKGGNVDMFALFDYYEEQGIKRGRAEGKKKEREDNIMTVTKNLMKRLGLSKEEAKKQAMELFSK